MLTEHTKHSRGHVRPSTKTVEAHARDSNDRSQGRVGPTGTAVSDERPQLHGADVEATVTPAGAVRHSNGYSDNNTHDAAMLTVATSSMDITAQHDSSDARA
jgi:hypothetical protein